MRPALYNSYERYLLLYTVEDITQIKHFNPLIKIKQMIF